MDTQDDGANPLMVLGLTILLVVGLLAFSGALGGGAEEPREVRIRGGGGVTLVPGAPVDGVVNSPVPNGPSVTIIEDVRDTMNRLPLDRNNPKGWTNPKPKPPRRSG